MFTFWFFSDAKRKNPARKNISGGIFLTIFGQLLFQKHIGSFRFIFLLHESFHRAHSVPFSIDDVFRHDGKRTGNTVFVQNPFSFGRYDLRVNLRDSRKDEKKRRRFADYLIRNGISRHVAAFFDKIHHRRNPALVARQELSVFTKANRMSCKIPFCKLQISHSSLSA